MDNRQRWSDTQKALQQNLENEEFCPDIPKSSGQAFFIKMMEKFLLLLQEQF